MFLFIPILDQQWLKHRTRLKMSFNMILCLLIYPDQTWRPMSCPLGKKLRWVNAAGLRVPTLTWTCALPQVFLATQGSTWSTCSPGDEGHLGQTGNIKENNYFPGTGAFFPHSTLRSFIAKKLLNWALLFCTQVDLAVFRDLDSRLSEREVGPVLWQSYEHKISFVK